MTMMDLKQRLEHMAREQERIIDEAVGRLAGIQSAISVVEEAQAKRRDAVLADPQQMLSQLT